MTAYEKIVELIELDKNLGSCSEMCAVACALGDPGKAPEPYNDIQKAWNRLNESQREAVNQYRQERGLSQLSGIDLTN